MWQSLPVHGGLQLLPMQEVEPPWHSALEKPSPATAMPQALTGVLTGVVIVFPEQHRVITDAGHIAVLAAAAIADSSNLP